VKQDPLAAIKFQLGILISEQCACSCSVASAGSDGLVVLWGLEGGEVQQVLDGHGGRPITCLEVMQHTAPADSTEYTALVTAASDRHVIVSCHCCSEKCDQQSL
jgi:WD40 repeat protein